MLSKMEFCPPLGYIRQIAQSIAHSGGIKGAIAKGEMKGIP